MRLLGKKSQNLNVNAWLATTATVARLELPRGMRDLDPEEYVNINYIRDSFFQVAGLFNFQIAEPSPLEMLATLEAKSGAAISNEIYAFTDKGGRNIALRFDLTIGLTRYVESKRDLKMPIKLASFGGVWRYDEPQSERYRYFHQWDIEIYGPSTQESDAEIIEFVNTFFTKLGLKVKIEINDRQLIQEFIMKKLGISSEEAILEMFRVIDKVPKKGAKAVLGDYRGRIDRSKLQALIELSQLNGNADEVAHRSNVKELDSWQRLVSMMDLLKAKRVERARINLGIVRGLDYYSGIVFEAFDDDIAGSAALVGGGRYDRLTEAFGRKDIGASGVAGGVERIVMALKRHGLIKKYQRPLVYIANATERMRAKTVELVSSLRTDGITVDYDMVGRTLRKQLEYASSRGAIFAVIIAPDEIAAGQVILKSMKDGTESKHYVEGLKETLSKMLPRD